MSNDKVWSWKLSTLASFVARSSASSEKPEPGRGKRLDDLLRKYNEYAICIIYMLCILSTKVSTAGS